MKKLFRNKLAIAAVLFIVGIVTAVVLYAVTVNIDLSDVKNIYKKVDPYVNVTDSIFDKVRVVRGQDYNDLLNPNNPNGPWVLFGRLRSEETVDQVVSMLKTAKADKALASQSDDPNAAADIGEIFCRFREAFCEGDLHVLLVFDKNPIALNAESGQVQAKSIGDVICDIYNNEQHIERFPAVIALYDLQEGNYSPVGIMHVFMSWLKGTGLVPNAGKLPDAVVGPGGDIDGEAETCLGAMSTVYWQRDEENIESANGDYDFTGVENEYMGVLSFLDLDNSELNYRALSEHRLHFVGFNGKALNGEQIEVGSAEEGPESFTDRTRLIAIRYFFIPLTLDFDSIEATCLQELRDVMVINLKIKQLADLTGKPSALAIGLMGENFGPDLCDLFDLRDIARSMLWGYKYFHERHGYDGRILYFKPGMNWDTDLVVDTETEPVEYPDDRRFSMREIPFLFYELFDF
ncbi:hypothetical protein ACFL56_00390 [Candidatus Margulisiibacteriota bacterium]